MRRKAQTFPATMGFFVLENFLTLKSQGAKKFNILKKIVRA